MLVMPILVIAAALALLVWAATQTGWNGAAPDSAIDIARRRYASGELTPEQFEAMKRSLAAPGRRNGDRSRGVPALLAVLAGLLLLGAGGLAMAWTAWGGDWDWDWNGMGHMMGGNRSAPPASASPVVVEGSQATVAIRDYAYSPVNLEVRAGTTVTWTNRDSVRHSATAKDGSWDTGLFARGKSASVTFERPGTFDYYCSIHPGMAGRVRTLE